MMKRCLVSVAALSISSLASVPVGAKSYESDYAWFDGIEKLLSDAKTRAEGVKGLETQFPGFSQRLKRAVGLSGRRWEESWNYDENAKAEIVKPAVLQSLGIKMTQQGARGTQSAGVMHTYGYLFSLLETPYGRKGKRWIEAEIDRRLDLKAKHLSVHPARGEFLANLTQVLDELSRRAEHRIEEVSLTKGNKNTGQWKVATFLVPFLKPHSDSKNQETHLLFYGVKRTKTARFWSWVTAFPVNEGMAQSIRKVSQPEGGKAPYQPRFNWNPSLVPGESFELIRMSYRDSGTTR